jgi:hypothetical protein
MSIAVVDLAARVEDPLPDRHPTLARWPSRCTARVDGRLLVLHATIIRRIGLVAYAGCGALGLLHSRLLDKGLRLTVQVACLGRRWLGHGLEQRHRCDELLACPGQCVRIANVEVSVDALAGLPA